MNNIIENGIAIPQETQQSIVDMNSVSASLAEMESKYATMPDVKTADGYALAKQERKEIGSVRLKVDKAHKAGKAFYLEGGRSIDAMKNDILKVVSKLENERKDAIKLIDDEKVRIEQEAAEKEQARIGALESRIESIKGLAGRAITLEQCAEGLVYLDEINLSTFQEFESSATHWIEEVKAEMLERKATLETQAAEAAKLEEQRLEQERIAAEQKAKQDQIDSQLKQIEDAKAEAGRKAEQEEREKALAAQAEQDKKEALKAAEEKRLADIEAARIAEQERIKREQEAEAKRLAEEKAEADRLASEAPDKVKIKAWVDSIAALPEVSSAAGKARVKKLSALIDQIQSV